jgi:hypothetical protein
VEATAASRALVAGLADPVVAAEVSKATVGAGAGTVESAAVAENTDYKFGFELVDSDFAPSPAQDIH